MNRTEPVKIPEIPGKINLKKDEDAVRVRYLAGRKYDPGRKYNIPKWVVIGLQIEAMPSLMLPNHNYDLYFTEGGEEMRKPMTEEEARYTEDRSIFGLYSGFFDKLYYEMRSQSRKNPGEPVNQYKADRINKVLKPLMEVMKDEKYCALLGLVETGNPKGGMNYGDVMVLLSQYRNAIEEYQKEHI